MSPKPLGLVPHNRIREILNNHFMGLRPDVYDQTKAILSNAFDEVEAEAQRNLAEINSAFEPPAETSVKFTPEEVVESIDGLSAGLPMLGVHFGNERDSHVSDVIFLKDTSDVDCTWIIAPNESGRPGFIITRLDDEDNLVEGGGAVAPTVSDPLWIRPAEDVDPGDRAVSVSEPAIKELLDDLCFASDGKKEMTMGRVYDRLQEMAFPEGEDV